MDAPELSPKLIAKLEAAGLEQIAEALIARDRIDLNRIDELPEFEQNAHWVCPEGYASPVGEHEQVNYFRVKSVARLKDEHFFFTATTDWSRMAVPICLLPSEILADPILKRWTWLYDNMAGESECKRLAKAIVRRRDGLKPEDQGQISFHVVTPKTDHTFITTGQWRGLKAPAYMVPDEQRASPRVTHVRVMDEDEVVGERQVKKAAKEWARNFDRIKVNDPNSVDMVSKSKRRKYWIDEPQNEKIKHVMRYLKALDYGAVISQSGALKELIDRGFETIPPESEWKRRKPYPWEIIAGKQNEQETGR